MHIYTIFDIFCKTLPWLTVKVSANRKYCTICQTNFEHFLDFDLFSKTLIFLFFLLFCFLNQTFLFDQQKVIQNGTFNYLVTSFIGSKPIKKLSFSFHLYKRLVHQFDCYIPMQCKLLHEGVTTKGCHTNLFKVWQVWSV